MRGKYVFPASSFVIPFGLIYSPKDAICILREQYTRRAFRVGEEDKTRQQQGYTHGVFCDFTMLLPLCLLLLGAARTRSFDVSERWAYTLAQLSHARPSKQRSCFFGQWHLDTPKNHSQTTVPQPTKKSPENILQYLLVMSITIPPFQRSFLGS